MPYQVPEPKIFACTQSTALGEKIAAAYGAELGNIKFSRYSDGEFQPSFEESVRGARIFIIGSTNPGPENLMEMLLMLDAAKRMLVRLVGVRFSHLVSGNYQINLFEDTEETLNLYQAMDKVRQRFGDRAVLRASAMGAKTIGRMQNPFNGQPPVVLAHRKQ